MDTKGDAAIVLSAIPPLYEQLAKQGKVEEMQKYIFSIISPKKSQKNNAMEVLHCLMAYYLKITNQLVAPATKSAAGSQAASLAAGIDLKQSDISGFGDVETGGHYQLAAAVPDDTFTENAYLAICKLGATFFQQLKEFIGELSEKNIWCKFSSYLIISLLTYFQQNIKAQVAEVAKNKNTRFESRQFFHYFSMLMFCLYQPPAHDNNQRGILQVGEQANDRFFDMLEACIYGLRTWRLVAVAAFNDWDAHAENANILLNAFEQQIYLYRLINVILQRCVEVDEEQISEHRPILIELLREISQCYYPMEKMNGDTFHQHNFHPSSENKKRLDQAGQDFQRTLKSLIIFMCKDGKIAKQLPYQPRSKWKGDLLAWGRWLVSFVKEPTLDMYFILRMLAQGHPRSMAHRWEHAELKLSPRVFKFSPVSQYPVLTKHEQNLSLQDLNGAQPKTEEDSHLLAEASGGGSSRYQSFNCPSP